MAWRNGGGKFLGLLKRPESEDRTWVWEARGFPSSWRAVTISLFEGGVKQIHIQRWEKHCRMGEPEKVGRALWWSPDFQHQNPRNEKDEIAPNVLEATQETKVEEETKDEDGQTNANKARSSDSGNFRAKKKVESRYIFDKRH